MKYKIAIYGSGRVIVGYWRSFDTGDVALFDSRTMAERVVAAWMIDGVVVQAL